MTPSPIQLLATYHPHEIGAAIEALRGLLIGTARREREALLTFVVRGGGLGLHAPRWAYRLAGRLWRQHGRNGTAAGTWVLGEMRRRLRDVLTAAGML